MSKKVLIGMSGGVDSSTAALLLQQQGYEVAGATLKLHSCKDRPGLCGSADDLDEARQICAQLGVAHYVLDRQEIFGREVMDRFVSEYCAGRTPNPCIECNHYLKFGAMLDWALENGFDYVATGHYARVGCEEATGRPLLLRGRDRHKDQSYVLYRLTAHQLSHLLLPIGALDKPAVRLLAEENALCSAHRPDSQDICFVPDGDYVRFLREYGGVAPVPGDFVDRTGRVLGQHQGLVRYTCGQRKGLGISADRPLYVVSKDMVRNTVLLGDEAALYTASLLADSVNWIAGAAPAQTLRVTAKTRYSQREADAVVTVLPDGRVQVDFDQPQRAVTAGQSVVFYSGDEVLGGGVILG